MRFVGVWTDENERHLLFEVEDSVVVILDSFLFTIKRSPTKKYINEVIDHKL
jgi:hypothetical protein